MLTERLSMDSSICTSLSFCFHEIQKFHRVNFVLA